MSERLGDVAAAELDELGVSIGATGEQRTAAAAAFARAIELAGWGDQPVGVPLQRCRISHGQPYGCSMVRSSGAPELRWMLEPQTDRRHYIEGVRCWGVDLAAHDVVADLFEPEGAGAAFELWSGAAVDAAGAITHKLYLPLTALGPERAPELAARALERLELGGVWPVPAFRPKRDMPTILGIEVNPTGAARIKLYVLHREVRAAQLSTPDGAAFATAMLGADAPIWWLECTTFAAGAATRTLHLGIPRHIPDSGEALDRLERFCGEPLPVRSPLHFVSIRRDAEARRLAIYFLPRGAR